MGIHHGQIIADKFYQHPLSIAIFAWSRRRYDLESAIELKRHCSIKFESLYYLHFYKYRFLASIHRSLHDSSVKCKPTERAPWPQESPSSSDHPLITINYIIQLSSVPYSQSATPNANARIWMMFLSVQSGEQDIFALGHRYNIYSYYRKVFTGGGEKIFSFKGEWSTFYRCVGVIIVHNWGHYIT